MTSFPAYGSFSRLTPTKSFLQPIPEESISQQNRYALEKNLEILSMLFVKISQTPCLPSFYSKEDIFTESQITFLATNRMYSDLNELLFEELSLHLQKPNYPSVIKTIHLAQFYFQQEHDNPEIFCSILNVPDFFSLLNIVASRPSTPIDFLVSPPCSESIPMQEDPRPPSYASSRKRSQTDDEGLPCKRS